MLIGNPPLRAITATPLLVISTLAVLLALLAKTVSAWSAQQDLKAELQALSNAPQFAISVSGASPSSDQEGLTELRRMVNSSAAHAAIREGQASGPARSLSDPLDTSEQSKYRGERTTYAVNASEQSAIDKSARTSMDDMVKRAKLAEIDVTTSQTAGALSASEPQVISASVKGGYSGVRSWLIELTDADPHLLLNSLQVRRANRDQLQVTAEIKFVRIEPVAVR